MSIITSISNCILPFFVIYIVIFGAIKKVQVYDTFIEGVQEGFQIVIKIAPTLVGLFFAVSFARVSGLLDIFAGLISPLSDLVGFPSEIVPLSIVKMFSSSAATGIAMDIFKVYGPDSYIGLIASIMLSCTETIFYTMSVYFMSVKITKTRWTVTGAIICSVAGIAASVIIASKLV